MKLPAITHLSAVILATLKEGEKTGQEVRTSAARFGVRRAGPAFYQLMKRNEDAGLIDGRYERAMLDEWEVTVRLYRLTASGRKTLEAAVAFYREIGRAAETTHAQH